MITELFINNQRVDLEKADTIAITKSVFDINKPSTRTSEYSNAFRVPKTQNNRLIFKSAGIVNSFNDEPYDQLTASIKVDGVEVAFGIAELMSSDEDYYTINVQAGNGSFYKSLKALSLVDLSESLVVLDHDYSAVEVGKRRDLENYEEGIPEGLIYPNVDYGWFERTAQGGQLFRYFYPALFVHYIVNSAINLIGYKQVGNFWERSVYKSLAIMAKNIVSDADEYFVDYSTEQSALPTRGTEIVPNGFIVFSPLNFTEEESDVDGLYVDTALNLGYVTFGYNFPVNFDSSTTWSINLNGNVTINPSVVSGFRAGYIDEAFLRFELQIWNKVTDTFVSNAVLIKYPFYSANYIVEEGRTIFQPSTESFTSELEIDGALRNPINLNAIGADATDHVLVWFVEVVTSTAPSETISEYDSLDQISFELEFDLTQRAGGDPNKVSVINSFDDVNIGSLFLYVCNVLGVYPLVDEALKTVSMVSFDDLKKNKAKAIDWSNKIDLSEEPEVSFKLDYAQRSGFEYNNDNKDVYLNELTNYGKGTVIVDNDNLPFEVVKYRSPFSLCAIAPTFNSTRQMAKIYTGDKYIFDGTDYNLDPEAEVDGFTTRVVSLARSTESPIQVNGGDTATANYEVNNTPILFDYVIRNRYSLLNDMLNKTKVVKALFNLSQVDFANFDFSKPIFVDTLNDYFVVNEISQFKVNEVDSTNVTLIRI